MKKNQFLLLKLMEECAEVTQRASKQIQFGSSESQKGKYDPNRNRLKAEILDLQAIISLLQDEREIDRLDPMEQAIAYGAKKQKLQKYLKYSAELGELPEINLYEQAD